MVRVYMVFTGSGPILLVTKNNDGMQGAMAKTYLANKGIIRYIAYEVSVVRAKERYGHRFDANVAQLTSDMDLRVLDIDGHHVFNSFDYNEMGEPVYVGGKEGD